VHHAVHYGFQAVFHAGLIGQLLGWAIPFDLDCPGDIKPASGISLCMDLSATLSTAAALLPRLETAVFAACTPYREYPIPCFLFVFICKLAVAFLNTRALALAPMIKLLGRSPIHEQE
jgi:hypothetical protein